MEPNSFYLDIEQPEANLQVTSTLLEVQYSNLYAFIRQFPAGVQDYIVSFFNKITGSQNTTEYLEVFNRIMSPVSRIARKAARNLQEANNLSPDSVREVLSSGAAIELAAIIGEVNDTETLFDKYRFPLGMLLAQTPYDQVPESIKQKLHISHSSANFQVLPFHPKFNEHICDEAESYMSDSRDQDYTLNLNGIFMQKRIGKPLALSAYGAANDHGTVIPGLWYVLLEDDLRTDIEEKAKKGKRLISMDIGTWVLHKEFGTGTGLTWRRFKDDWQKHLSGISDSLVLYPDPANMEKIMTGFNSSDMARYKTIFHARRLPPR